MACGRIAESTLATAQKMLYLTYTTRKKEAFNMLAPLSWPFLFVSSFTDTQKSTKHLSNINNQRIEEVCACVSYICWRGHDTASAWPEDRETH